MLRNILAFGLVAIIICTSSDPNTFSNYQDVKLDHLHIEWLLNVDDRYVNATSEYNFTVTKSQGISKVYLDIYQLDILFVYLTTNGKVLAHQVDAIDGQSLIQGDRLNISLDRVYQYGEKLQIRLKYALDERARALNFLTKEQTGGKTQPYVFSQCEMINARSMIPLQDTPAVKQTYTATIITRPEITVFMSGNQTNVTKKIGCYDQIENIATYKTTAFESLIPIQSYLIAIIAGDVTSKQVGKRTYVISEPIFIDSYATELSDIEEHLTTLENYIGPYLWGDYKIVIQPPSFPIGGMENPLLTFASPSIIVGDKSGVSVAIHEMAHSWTGNTVTCVNWSNFWLNEGMCVFLERKALANSTQYGPEYELIDAYTGNSALKDAIDGFKIPSYTSLYPIVDGVNPDDSFSEVPYEKGFQFLTYLEILIGPSDFQMMFRAYISRFQYTSIDHDQTREFFIQWLSLNKKTGDVKAIIFKIQNEWNTWIKGPGYPPVKLPFNTQRITDAEQLAQSYIDSNGKQPLKYKEFQGYLTNQKYIFLQYFSDNKDKLNIAIIKQIDSDQNLSQNLNKELLWRWFRSCLQSNYTDNIESVHKFLGSIGRQKMILPVYSELNRVNHDKAVQYFNEYYNFYHPLARVNIANIINSKFE